MSGFVFRLFRSKIIHLRKMSSVESKKPKIEVASNTIGTHSGTFHCDEILACYLLSKHPDFAGHTVLRTRDQSLLDKCDIVVDVGSIFDPSKKRFDHHQVESRKRLVNLKFREFLFSHQNTFNETFSSLRPEFGEKYNVRLVSVAFKKTFKLNIGFL